MAQPPTVLNVHTPSSSFAIVHSVPDEALTALYDKLSRKIKSDYHGQRVGPGWIKYAWNGSYWSLDDDSDYTIFRWRQQQAKDTLSPAISPDFNLNSPTIHLHDPDAPLPDLSVYHNPAYYRFQLPRTPSPKPSKARSVKSSKSKKSKSGKEEDSGILKYKKEFDNFHSENGVRTVMGSIGPVSNVRMLLKNGHRHVYVSRRFAMKHSFIPSDAAPGHYGYGGLISIGTWPITLTGSFDESGSISMNGGTMTASSSARGARNEKTVTVAVYLSEEPHFDVVLGRSFFEKRQIRLNPLDPTEVICMDTGEKIECEVVILKDGKGEIVTVT